MLSSIHPFGERARSQRYPVTAAAFVIGSVVGGTLLGGVLAGLSTVISLIGPQPMVALLVLLLAGLWDLSGLPVPSLKRQVDENWLRRYRGWVYGVGFGVQLGVGFATYVRSALTYGLALGAVAAGSPSLALLAGLTFGLVRGLSILLTARVNTPDQLRVMFSRLGELQNLIRRAGVVAVSAFAIVGLVVLA